MSRKDLPDDWIMNSKLLLHPQHYFTPKKQQTSDLLQNSQFELWENKGLSCEFKCCVERTCCVGWRDSWAFKSFFKISFSQRIKYRKKILRIRDRDFSHAMTASPIVKRFVSQCIVWASFIFCRERRVEWKKISIKNNSQNLGSKSFITKFTNVQSSLDSKSFQLSQMMHMMWWKMVSITDDLPIEFFKLFHPIPSTAASVATKTLNS